MARDVFLERLAVYVLKKKAIFSNVPREIGWVRKSLVKTRSAVPENKRRDSTIKSSAGTKGVWKHVVVLCPVLAPFRSPSQFNLVLDICNTKTVGRAG